MNLVVLTRAKSTARGALGTIKRIRGVPPGWGLDPGSFRPPTTLVLDEPRILINLLFSEHC